MNIYDFDDTIYDGDCSVNFFKYMFKRKPILMIWYFIKMIGLGMLYLIKVISFKKLKERLFSFVKKINNLDELLEDFWNREEHKIKDFYKKNQKKDDVIISASFEFILKPICKKLGIKHLIATKYDLKKGKIIGNNCKDFEKVKLFRKEFKDAFVNEAYSDSVTDVPMLDLAKKAYIVEGNNLILIKDYKFDEKKLKKYRKEVVKNENSSRNK